MFFATACNFENNRGKTNKTHGDEISTQQNWRFHHSPFLGFLDLGDLNL